MGQQVILAQQQLALQVCSIAFSNFNYISTIKFVLCVSLYVFCCSACLRSVSAVHVFR